ncbi:MAG: metallophosphoesterase family protein [Phycisphaerales bacterium JB038]
MRQPSLSRRQMLIGTSLGAAAGLLPVAATADERRSPASADNATLRFGVITDVHQDIMHDGAARLRAFVRAMREAKVDFIAQLGDFCVPHERNDAFLAVWREFDGPRYHVIGNHERDGGYNRAQIVEYFGMPNRYYSFDRAGVHFIVLDGNDRGGASGGYPRFIAEEQLEWLRNDLASTTRPTIVMIHQPLDSVDGVDNRAAVRTLLEQARRDPKQAEVIAVLAGHSHVDYCRLIAGIHYLLVNSASYQWVGGKYQHESYPPEVHAAAPYLGHTCPYREPLWAIVSLDLEQRLIQIEGRSTAWVGPSPVACGADHENEYWGWRPTYSQPRISSWRFPLPTSGDLG